MAVKSHEVFAEAFVLKTICLSKKSEAARFVTRRLRSLPGRLPVLTAYCHLPTAYCFPLLPDALADEVGHLDKEEAAVAAEAGLRLAREGVEAVAVHVVVVADVEARPGVRRPAQEELAARVPPERGVVDAPAGEDEARELVGAPQRVDVVVEGDEPRVLAHEPRLVVVQRHPQRVGRLVGEAALDRPLVARARVERRVLAELQRRRAHAREARVARAEVEVELPPAVEAEDEERILLRRPRLDVEVEVAVVGRALRVLAEEGTLVQLRIPPPDRVALEVDAGRHVEAGQLRVLR